MPTNWAISGIREALTAKKISARELAADYYKRIDVRNPELNAYLTLSHDRAYAQADRVDSLVAAGKPLTPLRFSALRLPAPSSSARPIAMSLRWAAPTKTPPTVQCATRKRPIAFLAARAVAPRRRLPRASLWYPSAPTPAARYGSPVLCAEFPP